MHTFVNIKHDVTTSTHTVAEMDFLKSYYIRQGIAGDDKGRFAEAIGPVYTATPFMQRANGIGSF
jgi:hypothetical protein